MARWEPDAAGRLQRAAMELYLERGYEQTTVADIADRAGLTARTFFRYFADKREVLFDGSTTLQQRMTRAVDDHATDADLVAMEAVAAALAAAADVLGERRPYARQRRDVIAANAELQERELIKLATLSTALADALVRRGLPDATASLAAETGVTVFRVAFERWVTGDDPNLHRVMTSTMNELRGLTTTR